MSKKGSSPPDVYGSPAEIGGGVGGVCTPPGTGGKNERTNESGTLGTETGTHSFIHSGGCTDQLAGTLLQVGVFVLSTPKRLALAQALVEAGVSADDVVGLAEFVASCEKDEATARRYLCAMLQDAEKRQDAIANLKAFRAARGRPKWSLPPVPEGYWDHDQQCRRAWCRVHSDRRTREEVAAEFGVGLLTLEAMLDRGHVICAPDPKLVAPKGAKKAAAADEVETKARLQRVQQMLAERRAVRA